MADQTIGALEVKISVNTDPLTQGLGKAKAQAEAFNASMSKTSNGAQQLGQSVALAGGQLQAMQHSARSFAEALAAGQAPAQALFQQLSHLTYAMSGAGGLKAGMKAAGLALVEFATNPLTLAILGMGAAVKAAELLYDAIAGQSAQQALEDSAKRIDELTKHLGKLKTAADDAAKGVENAFAKSNLAVTIAQMNAELAKQVDIQKRMLGNLRTEIENFGSPLGPRGGFGAAGLFMNQPLQVPPEFKAMLDQLKADIALGIVPNLDAIRVKLVAIAATDPDHLNQWRDILLKLTDPLSELSLSLAENQKRLETFNAAAQPAIATTSALAAALERLGDIDKSMSDDNSLATLRERLLALPNVMREAKQATKELTDTWNRWGDALEQVSFDRATIFMGEAEKAAANLERTIYGPLWESHINDAEAAQARLNVQLSQSYDLTRDFAGTFVHGILDGKSAVDSLSDALKNLESKIVDMALDAVVQGFFRMLTGGATGGGGNIFTTLLGSGSGVVPGSGGVFQHGGVVGSTPVPPIYRHGKLKYDEFPAILHVGERVIPVGGEKPQMSGEQTLRMLGGVPKFEGGWQPMLGAGGSTSGTGLVWTPGGTGGGGNLSIPNDRGGTLSYPAWSGGSGGGTVTLGSGGHSTAPVSLPRFGGYPLSPFPGPRESIIGTPIPSPFAGYDPALENPFDPFHPFAPSVFGPPKVDLPSFPFPKPPAYVPDFGFIHPPPPGGYYPEFDHSVFVPRAGSHTTSSRSPTRSLSFDDSGPSGGSTVGDIGQPYGGAGGVTPYEEGFGGAYRRQRHPGESFHSGGWVGSTPGRPVGSALGELFDHAPRLHAGLAADEYPAVLQAGERVIPRGGESAAPKVTVEVNNYGNSQVDVQQSDSGSGLRLVIAIDKMVAGRMRDGGSEISRTLSQMGARTQPVRR